MGEVARAPSAYATQICRMRSTIQSAQLESALASTSRPVRILDAHGDLLRIAAPAEALAVVKREPYEGGFRGAGVRYIRPIRRSPTVKWAPCYRTTEAASLPVEPTWLEKAGYRISFRMTAAKQPTH